MSTNQPDPILRVRPGSHNLDRPDTRLHIDVPPTPFITALFDRLTAIVGVDTMNRCCEAQFAEGGAQLVVLRADRRPYPDHLETLTVDLVSGAVSTLEEAA